MASALATRPLSQDAKDTRPENKDEASSDFEMGSDGDDPDDAKSETELELERAIFGDAAGFRSQLRSFGQQDEPEQDFEEAKDVESGLAEVTDADLFFLDAGPDEGPTASLATTDQHVADVHDLTRTKAVWHDPADEHLSVSLMSQPRLRKLRAFEGEDIISGLEYQSRLRRQYEVLHPRPKWADWKPTEARPRKRRRVDGEDSSGSGSEDDSDLEDVDMRPLDALMRSSASLLTAQAPTVSGIPKLRRDAISVTRMKEFAPAQPHAITSVSVHPHMPIILSSGLSGNAYVHRIRNRPIPPEPANPLLTTMHFKNIPLATTVFAPSPTDAAVPPDSMGLLYLSSRRRFMHTLNLANGTLTKIHRLQGQEHTQRTFEHFKPSPCGTYLALKGSTRKQRSGAVNILSAATGQLVCSVHIEAPSGQGVADFAWWTDSSGLSIVDNSGEVSEFLLSRRCIVARWHDEGRGITKLAVARARHLAVSKARASQLGGDTLVVLGSTLGLVTVYARSDIPLSSPSLPNSDANANATSKSPILKPLKTFKNLATAISHLALSPDAQLLALASTHARDALRLVHLPSLSVYANWPTSKTPIGRVTALQIVEVSEDEQGNEQENGRGEKRLGIFVGSENGRLRGWVVNG